MKKILYSGFYGFKNTGDDAFIEVCAWGGNEYWGTTNNIFLGSNLPKVINPSLSLSKSRFKGHNRLKTISLAMSANGFVSAGGSTFSKHSKYSLKDISLRTKTIFNKKLNLGAIGVSVGPFKNSEDEKNVVSYIKKMSFLAVRDKRSFDFVSSLNLPFIPIEAFDLAALLPEVYRGADQLKPKTVHSKKVIGVSVCNYERYSNGDISKEKARNTYILELLSKIPKDTNLLFRFFIFNGNEAIGDAVLTQEFVSQLTDRSIEVIPYLNNVYESWKVIKECDLMISTRMHASIFACYAGVPFFLVEYHQKCTDFLNDIGVNSAYRLFDGTLPIDMAIEQINAILYDNSYIKPLNISETIENSRRNFTEISI